MEKNEKTSLKDKLLLYTGLQKQTPYVKDYFYATNMRASIYMSVLVIVLELWMIIRLTRKIINEGLQKQLSYLIKNYFINYFILLGAGTVMLIFAVRFVTGRKDNKFLSLGMQYLFSFICIYFGIKVSSHDYVKGEQILTFLTMELFVVCLLTWRPFVGFLILTSSYLVFFYKIGAEPAFNTGTVGLTDATKINGFTMWLSTMLFCISNYNKTLSQALKDERLEKVNDHLRSISIHDELTGIHNMVYFRSEAEKLLNYDTTDKNSIIFLFFDIENFKSYNEKYGFHQGNEVLKKFAGLLNEVFSHSLVSRFSDDHFVVLTREEGCQDRVRELSYELKKLQGEVQLQLKCGAYKPGDTESDPSLACDRARFACNSIKKRYEKSFRLYDKTLEDKFMLKQHIVNNIDNAVENDWIRVYYQPVVSTRTGEVCGLEALARWKDPKYGLLPPGVFIEVLEEYRQIHKLDKCIIRQVCRDYRAATDKGEGFVPISLNFSRLDFELCDIVGYMRETAGEFKVPKEFLDVEITESALTDQQDFLQKAIVVLRDAGYKVWLDDFGSGYSSLNVLKDYHFDVLKIDMKFLSGFADNEKTKPIIKNIVSLTKQLDMVSLTEGVETKEQFEFLSSIGCDRAQGYLFSKPIPIDQLREKLDKGELKFTEDYKPIQF